MSRNSSIALGIMVALTGIVLLASAAMGGERALVPRDWIPPVFAIIIVVVAMLRDSKSDK